MISEWSWSWPLKKVRRKYNRERVIGGQWVCTIERSSKSFFIVPVKNRIAQTLTRIIQERIAPGSIIYNDLWKEYVSLKELDYVYQTVNHSINFIDWIWYTYTKCWTVIAWYAFCFTTIWYTRRTLRTLFSRIYV